MVPVGVGQGGAAVDMGWGQRARNQFAGQSGHGMGPVIGSSVKQCSTHSSPHQACHRPTSVPLAFSLTATFSTTGTKERSTLALTLRNTGRQYHSLSTKSEEGRNKTSVPGGGNISQYRSADSQ
ncbi:hypothetical protein BaRGS_00009950 [Batillaria attramentaria]|uniref:Uncharacterized protein n=1 Tax=Batillaria attramentaria TaxID=370345 RepID=A0ABD0LIC5_9CAEN